MLQELTVMLTTKWHGLSTEVTQLASKFGARLFSCVKNRFSWVFDPSSVALSAALFCPGQALLVYEHFTVSDDRKVIQENLLADLLEVLPNQTAAQVNMLTAMLTAVLDAVKTAPLLAIPATSCENERSFRSAGLLLRSERTSLSVLHFQQEHRIQQYFSQNQEGLSEFEHRQKRLEKAQQILATLKANTPPPRTTTPPTRFAGPRIRRGSDYPGNWTCRHVQQ